MGVEQLLPWGGASLSVRVQQQSVNATANVFFNPQPELRIRRLAAIDDATVAAWLQASTTRSADPAVADINRSIADVGLRQQMAGTLNAVRHAYWELVFAVDALETAKRSEALARQQLEDNKLRVQLGTVAQIDVVESESEVASRHQATIRAEGTIRTSQVALKQLMVADTTDPIWSSTLQPVDRPLQGARVIDVKPGDHERSREPHRSGDGAQTESAD